MNERYLMKISSVLVVVIILLFVVAVLVIAFTCDSTILMLCLFAAVFTLFLAGIFCIMEIERLAGSYECPFCHGKHVPSRTAMLLSPHIFTTRYLKCPHCRKRGWHKKAFVS